MAEKANQHFVPQFYFRFFSSDGKSICVLNRSDGRIFPTAPIKGQSSKRYFYGDATIESELSQIEGIFSQTLRKLKQDLNFDGTDHNEHLLLMQNIMLQRSRTLAEREKIKPMQDRLLQLHLECAITNDETLSEERKTEFYKLTQEIEADPQQYQGMQMSMAIESANHLMDLHPVLLHNKTNRPFIFGDAPVVFSNPHMKQIKMRGVLGMSTPGLIVYYPIGPNHCVMLFDEVIYKIKGLRQTQLTIKNLQDVMALNKLQIHNALQAIYFSSTTFKDYVKAIFDSERNKLTIQTARVVEAPAFGPGGKPMGDIMHTFEPQLPYVPMLSFMQATEVREQDYVFRRRP